MAHFVLDLRGRRTATVGTGTIEGGCLPPFTSVPAVVPLFRSGRRPRCDSPPVSRGPTREVRRVEVSDGVEGPQAQVDPGTLPRLESLRLCRCCTPVLERRTLQSRGGFSGLGDSSVFVVTKSGRYLIVGRRGTSPMGSTRSPSLSGRVGEWVGYGSRERLVYTRWTHTSP